MGRDWRFTGAEVLWDCDDALSQRPVSVAAGRFAEDSPGPRVDLTGFICLPGIIDVHGDGFERHLAPRRGAMTDLSFGFQAIEAELVSNGITTAMLAQFYSWEGGMRRSDFAARFLDALGQHEAQIDLRAQLRFETHMLDDYAAFEALVARHGVPYVVFNDHLPHDHLAAGKRPPRLTGTALKSGRSPEAHLALMQEMHARRAEVPAALQSLSDRLARQGVRLGSHDDRTVQDRAAFRAMGARIAEFPETLSVAEVAHRAGEPVVMGAPNVVRGASHAGKVSARDIVDQGYCTAIASDYHYPSLRRAVSVLATKGVPFGTAWRFISDGPARMLGLADRGRIATDLRADLVIVEAETDRVAATLCQGSVVYATGPVVDRFLNARG